MNPILKAPAFKGLLNNNQEMPASRPATQMAPKAPPPAQPAVPPKTNPLAPQGRMADPKAGVMPAKASPQALASTNKQVPVSPQPQQNSAAQLRSNLANINAQLQGMNQSSQQYRALAEQAQAITQQLEQAEFQAAYNR